MIRIYIFAVVTLSLLLGGCASTKTSLKQELRTNPTKAIEYFTKKLHDNPNQVSLMMGITSGHNKLGNYKQCIEWSDRALEQIPNHVPATRYKISCLRALGESEHATQLKAEITNYIRQRQNEYVAENKRRKRKDLKRKEWWIYASPFATGPAYPKHVHRNNISGCASVSYRINEHGKITNLQISNEYPRGFLTDSLTQYYTELELKPTKNNPQRISIRQTNRWRFNPPSSVNGDKFDKYCT